MGAADLAVVITSGTLPCVKATQAALRHLSEANPSARIICVFNQVSPAQCFTAQNIERSLGIEISHAIPYLKRLGGDLLAGTPFTKRSHALHKPLARLSKDIMGRVAERGA